MKETENNNITEKYTTVINNRQVERTVYKNGQTTIYGSFPPSETPHRKPRFRK